MLSVVQEAEEPVASTSTLPSVTSPNNSNKRSLSPSTFEQQPHKRVAVSQSHGGSSGGRSGAVAGKENNALGGGAGSSGATRLLWRGKLLSDNKKLLNGIAIVAHLFAVANSSPFQAPIQPSPFEDPFSSSALSSGADLCLGLEMMRGGNLTVTGEVQIKVKGTEDKENRDLKIRKERVEVETPTDVRVYIDPRCPETVDWFERSFCRASRRNCGITIDVGGDEVIIFASYPPTVDINNLPDERPALTLSIGRRAQLKVRKPRPDDPMPRDTLFASKLRRTSSLPALALNKPPLSKRPPLSRASSTLSNGIRSLSSASVPAQPKLKPSRSTSSLGSLLDGEKSTNGNSRRISSTSLKGKERAKDPSTKSITKSRAVLSRSTSQRTLFPSSTALPTSNPSSNRSRSNSFTSSLLALSAKGSRPFVTDSEGEENRTQSEEDRFVPGSPTPSAATTYGGMDDEDWKEGMEAKSMKNFESESGSWDQRRKGLQRSYSVPVKLGKEDKNQEGDKSTRDIVRKMLKAALTARGVGKDDERFIDVFQMTSKGVQYALHGAASPIDFTLANLLIETHLNMYIGPIQPQPILASSMHIVSPVKEEEEDIILIKVREMVPTPGSLEGVDAFV